MAVGEKLAMLVSFGFIGSVCWLVNQVNDPGDGAPVQANVRASELEAARRGAAGRTPGLAPASGAAASLRYASAVEAVDRAPRGPRVEVDSLDPERAAERAPITLPPLAVANRPTTTAVAEDENPPRQPPALAALAPGEGERLVGGPREQTQPEAAEELVPQAGPDKTTPRTAAQTAAAVVERTYVVQRGDALERVVAKLFGSSDRRLVRAVLDKNPAVARRGGGLIAGETLVLPAIEAPTSAGPVVSTGGPEPARAARTAPAARKDPAPRSARAASPVADAKRGKPAVAAKPAQPAEGNSAPAGRRDAKTAKPGGAGSDAVVTRADKPNRSKTPEPRRPEKRAKPRSPAT